MLLATVLLVAGCSSAPAGGGPGGDVTPPGPTGSATGTTAPARTGPVLPASVPPEVDPQDARTVGERCGVSAPGSLHRWPVAGGSLEGMVLGEGPRVALFLAQADDTGMCGWADYAAWVAAGGTRAVLWNRCGDGESRCAPALAGDPVAQTAAVVAWARATGARRLVLVGASKGGGIALAAATRVRADAVVDLSGSVDGAGGEFAPVAEAAAGTRAPLLLAMSPGDQDEAVMRSAFALSPSSPKAFVAMPGGHGWELVAQPRTATDPARVSPFGERVRRWVEGDYS